MSHSCTQHPQSPADYRCDSCFTLRCRQCVQELNGKTTCTSCGQRATLLGIQEGPASSRSASGARPRIPPPPREQIYGGPPVGGPQPTPARAASASPGGSGKLPGWLWFVLVYGVGNFILYKTTGLLLLPIPRR